VQNIGALVLLTEGHGIANDHSSHGIITPQNDGNDPVPEPLQPLVRNMETSHDQIVSSCLSRYAETLVEAAWSGSMCEEQLGRKLPLVEAIATIPMVLMSARFEYISKMEKRIKHESEQAMFRSHAIASFSVSSIYFTRLWYILSIQTHPLPYNPIRIS
jgi:hypothetical protein